MKKGYLGLLTLALVILITGCGGGGGGIKDDGNKGNPPPDEVQNVLNNFASAVNNSVDVKKTVNDSFSFPFTFTSFNSQTYDDNEIAKERLLNDLKKYTKLKISNQQFKWIGENAGEVTLNATVVTKEPKTAQCVLIVNMNKRSGAWKIASVFQKSVSDVFPDGIEDLLKETSNAIFLYDKNDPNKVNRVSKCFSDTVEFDINQEKSQCSGADWVIQILGSLIKEIYSADLKTMKEKCELTDAANGTISFNLNVKKSEVESYSATINATLKYDSGNWKFRNVVITWVKI